MKLKEILSHLIILLFTFSCTITPAITHNGTVNLEQKQKSFIVGITNKNDIIKEVGESLFKEYPDENTWIYIETQIEKKFFGNKKIIKNNVLLVEFNSKGILSQKNFLDKKAMNEIKFDDQITETLSMTDSYSKKFLSSMRKRFQNLSKTEQQN